MLTLEKLISEVTALANASKAIFNDKTKERMPRQIEQDILMKGVQKAQKHIAEIDSVAVQTIPGDIALVQIRQLLK